MELINYKGKKVKITDIDNQTFEGTVTDYLYPDENDSNSDSIIIDCTKGHLAGNPVEFWRTDIKSISIIR